MKRVQLFLLSGFLFFSQILFSMNQSNNPENQLNNTEENILDDIFENIVIEDFLNNLSNLTDFNNFQKTNTDFINIDDLLFQKNFRTNIESNNNQYKFFPLNQDNQLNNIQEGQQLNKEKQEKFIYLCDKYCRFSSTNIYAFRNHLKKTIIHKLNDEEITQLMQNQNPNYKFSKEKKVFKEKKEKFKYLCEHCIYATTETDVLRRHLKSEKHRRNTKSEHQLSNEEIIQFMQNQNPNYKPKS